MIPPLVSFVTWNRMGLTARNLSALLNTEDDFELHIVDNNSTDDTWNYLENLKDSRIKCKSRFCTNYGPIYATNFNLCKRKSNQFFVTVDNDVNIHTSHWISKFLKTFDTFTELGLLGAVTKNYYTRYRAPLVIKKIENSYYLQVQQGFVEGCCQCFHPKTLNLLGYWSEENYMGDTEICDRIAHYTPYKMGFIPEIEIDQLQSIPCDVCPGRKWCALSKKEETCFSLHENLYKNPLFRNTYRWKFDKCILEMQRGERTKFCSSIHDKKSLKNNRYDKQMAEENFEFYKINAN